LHQLQLKKHVREVVVDGARPCHCKVEHDDAAAVDEDIAQAVVGMYRNSDQLAWRNVRPAVLDSRPDGGPIGRTDRLRTKEFVQPDIDVLEHIVEAQGSEIGAPADRLESREPSAGIVQGAQQVRQRTRSSIVRPSGNPAASRVMIAR
jgi:hypothetical protein